MQKRFKLIIFGAMLLCGASLLAQSTEKYDDVILNGKPAKLNRATGEFILEDGTPKEDVKPIHSEVINPDNTSDFHIVKKGETLFALSKRYGVSLNTLKKINHLESNLISIGQNLRVRNFNNKITSTSSESNNLNVWIVSKGDTLYSISKKTNTTVAELKRLNMLTDNNIYIGQKLQLK